jgi:hypothetical protein
MAYVRAEWHEELLANFALDLATAWKAEYPWVGGRGGHERLQCFSNLEAAHDGHGVTDAQRREGEAALGVGGHVERA